MSGKYYDLDIDTTLSANDDKTIASQKAVKTYVDNKTVVDSSLSNSSENPVQNKVIKSALDNKQDTISDLGYIRNKVALVDDKISAIDVTDSGSSLPAASGYNLNDTFVNKTDKKLYTVLAPAYALDPDASKSSAITVDLTTGEATGFFTQSGYGGTSYSNMYKYYDKRVTSNPAYVHFNTGSSSDYRYGYIFLHYTSSMGSNYYFGLNLSNNVLSINYFSYTNGTYTTYFSHQLFDTQLELSTDYYVYITYSNGEFISTLSSTGYNTNIIETSTIVETQQVAGCSRLYYGGADARFATYKGMTIYLLDSMGNFLIADGALTWDSGVTLEDNTQYNDTTNEKTYYYNNSILYLPADSLPSQTGQSGKFLTTNGTNTSWASIDALPSQSGNSGKFLTTNGTAASWANASSVKFRDWSD